MRALPPPSALPLPLIRILAFVFCSANAAHGQWFAEFPLGGGNISFVNESDEDIQMAGIDFVSNEGGLLPVPPGTTDAAADPFLFLLSNSPVQVSYGIVGSNVTFPANSCTELSVGASAGADVSMSWGNALPVGSPVLEQASACAVPEPVGLPLFGFGLFGMLQLRRRRIC